jgi:hypothetical protein
MSLRADVLFTYDRRGRMLLTNEPDGQPAPRLFLARTTGGDVLRFGAAEPDALVDRMRGIIDRHRAPESLRLSEPLLAEVRDELAHQAPVRAEGGGPAYRFPETTMRLAAGLVQLGAENVDLVRDTYPWLYRSHALWQPCFVVVVAGAAASVCFASRQGVDVLEAGVETLPEFRGRGYAAAVTAAWGVFVAQTGRIPLYSTAWDNFASQAVAKRVGLVMFGTDATWR